MHVALLLVLLLVVLPLAGADGVACPSHLVVDSRARGVVAPSTQQASIGFCQEIHGGPAPLSQEARFLSPSADNVSVRFLFDFGANVTSLPVVLDGMGYANASLTLARAPFPLGGFYYDLGGWLPIPVGASGALRATVHLPDGTNETVSYQRLA